MEFDGFYISIGDQCSFVLEKHGFILLALQEGKWELLVVH